MSIQEVSKIKCQGGHLIKYQHSSKELSCDMKFNVFLPKESEAAKVPVIYFLSGLTSTEDNCTDKSGALAEAAKHGLAFVSPDTSPRNVDIEGDSDSWDFGKGAGFYLNATEPKWKKNYRMYSYVVKELFETIGDKLPIDNTKAGIMGFSMGGHGALSIYLKNREQYKSVSAFAPIANPINCPWGQKAFSNYLGTNQDEWKQYDTVELLKSCTGSFTDDVLVDVGTADNFLENQLSIETLKDTVEALGKSKEWNIRYQEGYNHSFYFISTFIADHIQHHAKSLKN